MNRYLLFALLLGLFTAGCINVVEPPHRDYWHVWHDHDGRWHHYYRCTNVRTEGGATLFRDEHGQERRIEGPAKFEQDRESRR